MKNIISQSLGLDLVNINVYAKVYQNIPVSSRDRAIFTFFRIWTSATTRPIPNDIRQSLGLHLVNINAYAKFYQNIPNGLSYRHFSWTGRRKIFTNSPRTKSSQTVRWQNQMFDYRMNRNLAACLSVCLLAWFVDVHEVAAELKILFNRTSRSWVVRWKGGGWGPVTLTFGCYRDSDYGRRGGGLLWLDYRSWDFFF